MDGREVTTLQWWDYKGTGQEWVMPSAALFGGEATTTLTVTPEHMTGDWILVVKRNGLTALLLAATADRGGGRPWREWFRREAVAATASARAASSACLCLSPSRPS